MTRGSASMPARHTIVRVTSRPAAEQHLRDLARLRRVRDRIDREYAQPLDVEALARGAHMSAGHLSREFKLAYGESPYSYLMTRRIERLQASDAEVVQEPVEQPYGIRDCAFRDPAGNLVRIQELR
jgi:transcriptional regulator GlxA family with amidase domain